MYFMCSSVRSILFYTEYCTLYDEWCLFYTASPCYPILIVHIFIIFLISLKLLLYFILFQCISCISMWQIKSFESWNKYSFWFVYRHRANIRCWIDMRMKNEMETKGIKKVNWRLYTIVEQFHRWNYNSEGVLSNLWRTLVEYVGYCTVSHD